MSHEMQAILMAVIVSIGAYFLNKQEQKKFSRSSARQVSGH